jgi:hypothetical protein
MNYQNRNSCHVENELTVVIMFRLVVGFVQSTNGISIGSKP